ncbi:MAG: proton-conducting transporter membrane subunit [Candidatus Omnitrophota bacterium]|jgi:multicomponent Na+:H+ antiporter subunit D
MHNLLIIVPICGIFILNIFLKPFRTILAFCFAAVIFISQIIISLFYASPFSLDALSSVVLLCIGIVSLASLLVTQHTVPDETKKFRFINLLITASIGMSGIVMVKDIFSMYVFLEVTAISSFILIAFDKNVEALEGSFKYMMLSAIATVLMLSAVALFLLGSVDMSFDAIQKSLFQSNNALTTLAVTLFMCGLFIKGGLVPFHGWVPDAYMTAPASASVLLAGIVTKVSGIYTLIRVTTAIFGFSDIVKNILLAIGAVSILVGAFAALGQTDFKRMLAYSSISQVGYIIIGLGTGSALGIAGAVFHLFNHAIFKSLLFVNSAAVEKGTGTNDMQRMGGISSKMPVTGFTSVVGILSVCGIPPLSGFWSKIIIIVALWQAGRYPYAVIAILASVLTLAYLLSMQRRVFFGKLKDGLDGLKEAGWGFMIASSLLAVITIGVGIFSPYILSNLILPIKEIFIK